MPRLFARYSGCVAAFLIWGCNQTPPISTPVDKVQINPSDVTLTPTSDNAPADGVSTNAMQLQGGPSVSSFNSEVTFNIAPNGLFTNDSTQMTVPLEVNGQATVYALSRMQGPTMVTVSVGGVTKATQTTFTFAWPSEVVVTADSTFLTSSPGISTGVTAALLRNPGKVSAGTYVNFTASDSVMSNRILGKFKEPTVSDTSGTVVGQYFVIDTSYHGLVLITGAVVIAVGDTVKGTTILQMR